MDCFDRCKQAVKVADVFGIEKMWAAIYKGADNMGILVSRKVIGHRIFLGRLDEWEVKNFIRRRWKSHGNPEFERSIAAGTMHMVYSKRKGIPIRDYYVAGRAWNILYQCEIV